MISDFFKNFFGSKSDSKSSMIVIAIFFVLSMLLQPFKDLKKDQNNWLVALDGQKNDPKEFSRKVASEYFLIELIKNQLGGKFSLEQLEQFGLITNPVQKALQDLIQNFIFNKVAKEINLEINPETVKKKILEMLPVGNSLAQLAKDKNEKIVDIENDIKQGIINQTILSLSLGGLFVPEFVLKNAYNKSSSRKKLDLILFKATKKEANQQDAKQNEELTNFYNKVVANGGYIIPESRVGDIVEFDHTKANLEVNPEEISNYYNQHKADFVLSKPRITVRVVSGEKAELEKLTTSNLAEYLTKNPKNVKELKSFVRGTYNPELEKQAFALSKNELSPVFKNDNQEVLVEVLDRIPTTYKALADVSTEIKNILKKELVLEKIKNIDLGQLTNLDEFIKNLGGFKKSIKVDSETESEAAEKLFKLDLNQVAKLESKTSLIVLNKINPKGLLKFNDIKSKVLADFNKEQALEEVTSKARKALAKVTNETFDKVAKDLNGQLIKTDLIGIDEKDWQDLTEKLKSAVFIDSLKKLTEPNSIIHIIDGDKSLVANIVGFNDFDQADYDSKKETIRREILNKYIRAIREGFIASLERTVKIKYNNESSFSNN